MLQAQIALDKVPQCGVDGCFHGGGTRNSPGLCKKRVVDVDQPFGHTPEYIYIVSS